MNLFVSTASFKWHVKLEPIAPDDSPRVSDNSSTEIQTLGNVRTRKGTRRKVVVIALILALTFSALFIAWGPLMRYWTCESTIASTSNTIDNPLGILNVPYGGNASLQSEAVLTDHPGVLVSMNYTRGSASPVSGNLADSTYNISVLRNVSQIGFDRDSYCAQEFAVTLDLRGSPEQDVGAPLASPPNVTTDFKEPQVSSIPMEQPGYKVTPHYDNGFDLRNMPNITTCNGESRTFTVTSHFMTLWFPYNVTGLVHLIPYGLTTVSNIFTYTFPANYGTWEIDNLSASGGPGGGWAFQYYPC